MFPNPHANLRYDAVRVPPDLQHAMMQCSSVAEMRALAPLPVDAQRLIDQAVVRAGLDRLAITADLISEGMVFPLANPMSVMHLYWESINRFGHAQRVMLPDARGERQMPDRKAYNIPIYITMDDFSLSLRTLAVSQRAGQPLDVTQVEEATRNVNEAIEDSTINGAGIQAGGFTAPGILNAPNVNSFAYTGAEAWDVAGHTGEEILADVMGMIDMLQALRFFGPYNLYVPTTYSNKLNNDFKANGDKTILQRLGEINAGGRNLRIRTADLLPANRTVLMQMTSDVMDIVDGQRPTQVSWTGPGGFVFYSVIMSIIVQRPKTTYEGRTGIVLGGLTV